MIKNKVTNCRPRRQCGREEVQLHTLLTWALDRGEWLNTCPGRFNPWREPRYPLNRRSGGPHSRSGRFGEKENTLPLKREKNRIKKTKINITKPIGFVMHQKFNIQQLYALPTLYLCVLYLSENKQRLVPLTA